MAYFTVEEFRARYPKLTEAAGYTDDKIDEYRTIAEEAIEDACGVAFEPRTETDRPLSGDGSNCLWLPHARIRSVTAASDTNGTIDVSDATIAYGRVYLPSGVWTTGNGNLTVTYTHGYDSPPGRIKLAAMLLTKQSMVQGPVDERATQMSTEFGAINLATPGMFGSEFGIPEVDAAVARYRERVLVA